MESAVMFSAHCVVFYPLHARCNSREQEERTDRAGLVGSVSSQRCDSSDLTQKGSEGSLNSKIQVMFHISKILAFWDRWLCLR